MSFSLGATVKHTTAPALQKIHGSSGMRSSPPRK